MIGFRYWWVIPCEGYYKVKFNMRYLGGYKKEYHQNRQVAIGVCLPVSEMTLDFTTKEGAAMAIAGRMIFLYALEKLLGMDKFPRRNNRRSWTRDTLESVFPLSQGYPAHKWFEEMEEDLAAIFHAYNSPKGQYRGRMS